MVQGTGGGQELRFFHLVKPLNMDWGYYRIETVSSLFLCRVMSQDWTIKGASRASIVYHYMSYLNTPEMEK
jgi:hypothetical protein